MDLLARPSQDVFHPICRGGGSILLVRLSGPVIIFALTMIERLMIINLNKFYLDNVESMLSSKTEGVGKTTSWMYCIWYVW